MPNCKSILIVEDDQDIRESLVQILQLEGYETIAVGNGKEGLILLPNLQKPCLILLDLMMPVMDGWEFLKAKQTNIKIAPIPVVIVTAIENPVSTTGAVGLIKKPIEFDILLKVVQQYCGMFLS